MAPQLDHELGKLAVAKGLATESEVVDCLRAGRQAAVPMNLAQVMLLRGLTTQEQVNQMLQQMGEGADYPPATATRIGANTSFARYQVLSELGRGGMGAVYKARDPLLDRIVALKILSDRFIASDEDVHRFQRESKLAARLRHVNLVQIFEAGIHQGTPYFTMEYIEGQTLDEVLIDEMACAARPDGKPRLSVEDKVRILIKVAEAVHLVHRAGIIHRDVKPGNIIIDAFNEPHVMDFGLAREIHSRTMLTSTGTAMGTPYYMPPEQASGDVHHLDARADVYALGAVLYHALTLKLPFMEATAAAVLRRVIDDDPVAPRQIDPSIDRALECIVIKAMSKDRADRYMSAGEFARDLERYLAGQPVAARRPSIVRRARRWMRRHPAPATAVGVAGALIAVFAMYLFYRPGRLTLETTPAGAEAFIDGRRVGLTPIDVRLTRGRHAVRASLAGHRDLTFEVEIGGGRSELRRERLEQRLGRVTLESEPTPAEVRLDGPKRVTLQTPVETLTLPAGKYRMEVFRPQHELASLTIEVGDRADGVRKVTLREAERWKFRALDGIWRAPALADLNRDGVVDVIVVARDGRAHALSGKDGKPLWVHESRAANPTDVVVHEGDVLFGVGTTGFVCLRGSDGAVKYFVKTGNRTFVAPAPGGDVVSATWDGVVTRWSGSALAGLKPEKHWSVDLGARIEGIRGIDSMWFVRGEQGRGWLVPDGGAAKAHGMGATYRVGEDGVVSGDGWKFRADQAVRSAPLEVDVDGDGAREVAFGADDQRLYVLDARTGALRWYFNAGGNVAAPVAAVDVTGDGLPEIVFATTEGVVRAVGVASR